MNNNNKALMSHYIEGAIISRDLERMMYDYAADMRFDLELADELEDWRERAQVRKQILIHTEDPNV